MAHNLVKVRNEGKEKNTVYKISMNSGQLIE